MTKSTKRAKLNETETINTSELFVVGVGASAGGLDAISKFLGSFNGTDKEFCVVIVMHLSPDHKSELTSILGKRCKWPVITAENDVEMKPRSIYVTPQNSNIHVEDTKLMLDPLPEKYSSAPSIDNFLTSLAQSKARKGVGIILSGFGSDGSEGIRAIKRHNGLTMAQLPETAEHKDMPTSAMATGKVDVTIPAEQMFDEIVQYINNSNTIAQSAPPTKKSMEAIFELLEKRSGTDFSLYKPTTIMRRINHRMGNLQLKSLVDYYERIKNSPRELDVLFETVLIGVTEFFRDEEAYEGLKKHLEIFLEDKNPGDSIRIWSVGCATGEEPYSVGILLHEILGKTINQYHVQIFASDIDEKALNFGRKGIYGKESLENMSPELINRYFEKRGDHHYEIVKEIKQHTLFTRHDISNDPPFVKLDIVTCRNLLIYFNNDLQKQSFQIFHYSLRPMGLLFLGKSESVSVAADLFTKTDTKKIFRKADSSLNYQLRFSRFKDQKDRLKRGEKKQKGHNMSIVDVAKETLYYKFEHPFVIVNSQSEVKEVHGSLRLYLEIGQGTMNANLHKMANPELVTVLKALQAQVKKTGVPHLSHVIKFELYDNEHYVQVRIAPLIYKVGDEQYYLVMFQKVEPSEQILDLEKKLDTQDFVDLRIKELEDELASTKEHLQIFTEELEATNEELQTINEELQSANEELKSSNEELETSNEELQSANEELNTANHEMRLANEELVAKEKELQEEKKISERNEIFYRAISEHIPNGTVGILNGDYKIEYVAGKGFDSLDVERDAIVGKAMPDLNPDKEEAEKLRALCKKTFEGEEGFLEFRYGDQYFEIHTLPLELSGDNDPKILYLAQEVTEKRKLLYKVSESEQRFRRMADTAPVTIWITDGQDKCTYINKNWLEYTGSKLEDCLENGWLEYIHPEDRRRAMEKFLEASDEREAFELEYMVQGKDDSYRWFLNRAHPRFDNNGRFDGFVGINIDITDKKEFTDELEKKVIERTGELEISNKELVKLNMSLEEYAYVASHDLQEPVRKIRTFNSLLQDKSEDKAAVEKYSEKIESSADRMTKLIRNILDYSRLNEGRTDTEKVDLDEILQELESDLELMIEENDVQVTSGGLGAVQGVRTQIFQLFANLVRNSIKFNERKPKITIDAQTVNGSKVPEGFDADVDGEYKKLTFIDNGIGFDATHSEDIFKPFKRLHSKSEYSGTGIGLAICKRIVDLHEGFIDVESEKGKGSEFSIYFPMS